MKFQYRTNEGFTIDPFADNIEYYSLGKLDDYNFRRRKFSEDQSKLLADIFLKSRLEQLRKKYSYIRLWFSGGKDSTLALNSAIKHNVFIDEIVVIKRTCKNGPNLYPDYAQVHEINAAIQYLDSVRDFIPNTIISVVEIDDEHHETILENFDWYRYSTEWFFCIGYSMNMFYRYINPKFHLLKDIPNRCDLCGAAVPEVWYDRDINKWKFQFDDAVFVTAHGGISQNTVFEDFLISEDSPLLLEFFVNTIADDIEQEYLKTGNVPYIANHGERQRATRNRSALYKTLENYVNFQFKKILDPDFQQPFEHPIWELDPQPKGFYELVNRDVQKPHPRCYTLYKDETPWDIIIPRTKNRSKSKMFILDNDK